MAVADAVATRSRCTRAQVGAVVVTADNRVAAVGYNGPAHGLPVEGWCSDWCPRAMGLTGTTSDYDECPAIHAEANALMRSDFTQIHGGTIYSARACCMGCAKLISNSGLARVVHRVTEEDMHRGPDGVELYLRACGLDVVRVVS